MATPHNFLLAIFGLMGFKLMASSEINPDSVDSRIYDVEAQIAVLKNELEAIKSLATQEKPNAFNPSIAVVGDLMGQYGFLMPDQHHSHHGHDHEFNNGILVRELEFEFRGDVDPFADALVTLAVEPHGLGKVKLHLEEAFMRLKKWPGLGFAPLGMIIKAGQFKTSIGRMNRIHRHNLAQVDYSLAMRTFLGEEGHQAPGLSVNLAFNPSSSSALNLYFEGVFSSRLPMQDKGAEKVPTGIAHAWWHQQLAQVHFLDIGASVLLGRKGDSGTKAFWLLSNDIHYSYLPAGYSQNPIFLFGNEVYVVNPSSGSRQWPVGNFTWAQLRLFSSTFFGLRYDLAPKEEDLLHFQHAVGAYLTHYTTEFLRFRLGYEHIMPELTSWDSDHRLMLSVLFILGSHPVEPYFVNR